MVDEERDPTTEEQQPADESQTEEEIVEPRSKYELIMMAAAEATRLNDEIRTKSDEELRRKGINVEGKVTLEALRRVREGKVKAVVHHGILRRPAPPTPAPETPMHEGLFFTPPKPDEEESTPEKSEGDAPSKSEE
ncbi:MAG: hypothetical protein GF330_06345 [Candidatus Eisenbacteria bacterium]|nr:hypothetical protein [Candidatus Eisenbacteria bacterium]